MIAGMRSDECGMMNAEKENEGRGMLVPFS
jgi:hypothetical protein